MKIPYKVSCPDCGEVKWTESYLHESTISVTCPKGHESKILRSLDETVGWQIHAKSTYELTERKDWSMSIVLSAAAFECELTDQWIKWRNIDELTKAIGDPASLREMTDEQLEQEMRRYRTIKDKIVAVTNLINPAGLEAFVAVTPEIRDNITKGFPSLTIGSLAESYQKNLFWPRNRILHAGDTERYTEPDAVRCLNIARMGLRILFLMDQERRKTIASRK